SINVETLLEEVLSAGIRAAPFAPGERLTGFVVGAPPRCEPAGTLRTRGGCSYRGREVDRLFVGAPPRCEPARHPSHPGRVLLRGCGLAGPGCSAPALRLQPGRDEHQLVHSPTRHTPVMS